MQTGIAWSPAAAPAASEDVRHACKHDHHLQAWGWDDHNGRDFGRQFIGDDDLNLVRGGIASLWRTVV